MTNIEQWYKQASKQVNVYYHNGEKYLIYKGFRLSKIGYKYKIRDVRYSEFYTPVKTKDYITLKKHGFIEGVDIINYKRNLKRIKSYFKKINFYIDKKSKAEQELPKDKSLNEKRIRTSKEKIKYLNNLINILEFRNEQFKIKYKWD